MLYCKKKKSLIVLDQTQTDNIDLYWKLHFVYEWKHSINTTKKEEKDNFLFLF